MKSLILVICSCVSVVMVRAQTPDADFNIPANACFNQNIPIQNQSTSATSYEWDFCQGDLALTPAASKLLNLGGSNGGNVIVGVDFIQEGGMWYGFFCSTNTNSIFRLDFGANINNSAPIVNNLGSIDDIIRNPQDIRVLKDNSQFFAFISSRSGNRLTRLSFGDHVTNTPTADVMLTGNAPINTGLDVAFDGLNWVVVLTNTNTLTLVRIGNALSNTINISTDVINTSAIPNTDVIGDISLIKEGSNWYGVMVSVNTKAVFRSDFGTTLFATPSVVEITNGGIPSSATPYGIWCAFENGNYHAFITTIQGNLIRYDFGATLTNGTPVSNNLTSLSTLSNTLKLTGVRDGSRYLIFTSNWSANDVFRINFPQAICNFSYDYTNEDMPLPIIVNSSGEFSVTLFAHASSGLTSSVTKKVNVAALEAPDATFINDGVCVGGNVVFIPNKTGLSYNWSFNDGSLSTDENPVRQYNNAGNYSVELTVTAENGCNNYTEKTITIYNEPVADFDLPIGDPVCTNNLYSFENRSVIDEGSPITWQWKVNDEDVADAETLQYTFTSTSEQSITLTASIPGCSDEMTKTIPALEVGPVVDFNYEGHCQEEEVAFTGAITGDVISYQWNIDGNITSEENPQYTFSTPGEFEVKLTTENAAGCSNSASRSITIYTKPVADFSVNPPPYSCTNSSTPFTDLTQPPADGGITAWLWDFNDNGSVSDQKNPSHTYTQPGDYPVKLKVTTGFGCSVEIEKVISIAPSPFADFSYTPACVDVPVAFTSLSQETKAMHWLIDGNSYFVSNPTYTYKDFGLKTVKLTATGNNDCETIVTKNITVPVPLRPDFTVFKNCVDQSTVFTDITSGADPVATVAWDFAGLGISDVSPAEFPFSSTGNKSIKLTVNSAAGCSYTVAKTVSIVGSPKANFTTTLASGAAPLEVQFTNTSTSASSYSWNFADGSVPSNEVSPLHVFQPIGTFAVELTAFNGMGCEDKFSKMIETVMPLPDVEVKLITLLKQPDDSYQIVITLHNKGNTVLKNLPIHIDLSDNTSLVENITESIPAFSLYNYVPAFRLIDSHNLRFICASAELENDLDPDNNFLCNSIVKKIFLYPVYPNPVDSALKIEWIGHKEQPLFVSLADAMGKVILDKTLLSTDGFNRQLINVENLPAGVYVLVIHDGVTAKTQRLIVGRDR